MRALSLAAAILAAAAVTAGGAGVAIEKISNNRMLELETLAPLVTLPPGGEASHEERWELHRDLDLAFDEADVRAKVEPLANRTPGGRPPAAGR
jgi:hypothetical protein